MAIAEYMMADAKHRWPMALDENPKCLLSWIAEPRCEAGKQRGVIQISGGSKRPESAHLSFERCWSLAAHDRGSVRAYSRFSYCNAQHSVTRFHSIPFFS